MKEIKLKELLETVHQLADKIGQVRQDVKFCEDCKGKRSQEEHREKHLEEALEIKGQLPHNLVWDPERVSIEPTIKLIIDGKGHITANLDEVKIS